MAARNDDAPTSEVNVRTIDLRSAWVSVLMALLAHGAASAEDLHLGKSATVTGRLEIVVRFGPPNYGEDPATDLKLEIPVLMLHEGVRVIGESDGPNRVEPFVARHVQLRGLKERDAYALLRKDVRVTGRLDHSIVGGDFFPLVMLVERFEAIPESRLRGDAVVSPTPSAAPPSVRKE